VIVVTSQDDGPGIGRLQICPIVDTLAESLQLLW
jgi:hypothetical protein